MNQNFEDVRSTLQDILERRMKNEKNEGLKIDFIKVAFGIRFIQTLSNTQIATVWNGIRINDALSDFILDTTREFLLRCFNSEYRYENLCDEIASSFDVISGPMSQLDKSILDFIPNKNISHDIFFSNPWYTLLYICEGLIALEDADG